MKISILLPFRNAAPWIEETINSILNQSHANWELLAIDDASTDPTRQIIESFEDSRIQVITNNLEGIIPALKTGLDHATGSFITRMDADDLMPPKKLELLLEAIDGHRDISTGKVAYFSETAVSKGYQKYELWLNQRIENNDHYDCIYRECVIASPNWLASTAALKEDHIFDQLNYPEDYDMTFLWKENGYRIKTVDEVTHLWREHPARTSRNSEVYDQYSFFQLKLDWFYRSEEGKTLGIFGVGPKGKLVVEHLQKHYDISWFDHEFERYAAGVQGLEIKNPMECKTDLLLLAVYPENKTRLEDLVTRLGYSFGKNVWYV